MKLAAAVASIVCAPALLLAQPAGPSSAEPPPTTPSGPPPGPSAPDGPYPGQYVPPAQSGPPTPSGPPAPYGPQGYAPQPYTPPPYQPPPPPPNLRHGLTFEVNLGPGWIRLAADGRSANTTGLGASFGIGLGGWLGSQLALTGRISSASHTEDGTTLSASFFGASAQYWIDDHLWIGGGAGVSVLGISTGGDSIDPVMPDTPNDFGFTTGNDTIDGFAFNARAGYTFNTGSANTFNVSLEVSPGFYSDGADGTATAIGLQIGYQHL